ncbi:nuclease-related domain-containing protein [Allobacillus sp. GCM10007491]|uniref:NERD domain-containing protein n=2 Tax=Allobacillus saliphilus TaxID=2912308 RepID=A0A941HT45_9BACI|nr:NERD domain-containing protein [Allobacillus saliphilus]
MIFKERKMSDELQMLQALDRRMALSPKDHKNYQHLLKGFRGEAQFDQLLANLSCAHIQIHDLLLEHNGTVFQIDSLLIMKEKIIVYEVKNYQGEFFFEQERFFKVPRQEIMNPLHQIGRTAPILTQLLRKHGFNIPIQFHVVFVNPEFTLFYAEQNTPIILPTQIKSHLQILDENNSRLNETHNRLAKKLVELHLNESPYQKQPEFEYGEMKKGVVCGCCGLMEVEVKGRKVYCKHCNWVEHLDTVIVKLIMEYKLLFPNKKVTVSAIDEWCGSLISLKSISRILGQYFTRKGSFRWTYYE